MTDELETEFFARLDPPTANPFENGRPLIDGDGNKVGVALPSAAFRGALMICLDKRLVAKLRTNGETK